MRRCIVGLGALLALYLPASAQAGKLTPIPDYCPTHPSCLYGSLGGIRGTVDTDAEVVNVVNAMDAAPDGGLSILRALNTLAERQFVQARGLDVASITLEAADVATGNETRTTLLADPEEAGDPNGFDEPNVGGQVIAPPTVTTQAVQIPTTNVTRAGWVGWRRDIRYDCTHRSAIGLVRWRYRTLWRFYWTGSRVGKASHWEYPVGVGLGWHYIGSQYLQPYGRVGTWMVGRKTMGTFNFSAPIGGTVAQRNPKLTVKVYGNGGSWWDCTGK